MEYHRATIIIAPVGTNDARFTRRRMVNNGLTAKASKVRNAPPPALPPPLPVPALLQYRRVTKRKALLFLFLTWLTLTFSQAVFFLFFFFDKRYYISVLYSIIVLPAVAPQAEHSLAPNKCDLPVSNARAKKHTITQTQTHLLSPRGMVWYVWSSSTTITLHWFLLKRVCSQEENARTVVGYKKGARGYPKQQKMAVFFFFTTQDEKRKNIRQGVGTIRLRRVWSRP